MVLPSSLSVERIDESFQAQTHLWNHTLGFINSMSLKCAVQLGIPDIVHNHGRPMAFSELVMALSIPTDKAGAMDQLMNMLVHSGYFAKEKIEAEEEEEKEGYVLAPPSRLLLKQNPINLSPYVLSMLDPFLVTPWHSLAAWFKGSEPVTPFEAAHGKTLWDLESVKPELNNHFNEAMACDAHFVVGAATKVCRSAFEGLTSLVDVGGGTGAAAKSIVKEFPHLKCMVLDLPHVVANLQEEDNIKYIAGDMFDSIPSADSVLIKVLHDWSDEDCIKILKRCKEAIPSQDRGGKVMIIEMVLGDRQGDYKSTETQHFFDMMMLTLVTGKERSEKEWKKIILEAGFSHYKITPGLGLRSLIEVYP